MSRYISKIELDTQERYPCNLCFTEKNKLTRRTAHPLNGKTFIEIKLPRTLGATQLHAAFFSEDLKTELAITEFIWYNIETELDVYRAKVPKEKLGVGLYYIDICVKSFSNRFCLRRVRGDFLLTKSSYEGSLVQLSIYDFKYEQPSEILGGIIYHIFVDRFNRSGRSGKKEAAIILDGPWDSIPEFPEYAGAPIKNNIFYGGTIDGTEINRIIKMLITWSCHLFFLSAAKIPKPRPIGTPIRLE